jgi:hypothetical protein
MELVKELKQIGQRLTEPVNRSRSNHIDSGAVPCPGYLLENPHHGPPVALSDGN